LKKILRISLKIVFWTIGVILFLIVGAWFLIRVPAVQDFARKKTVSYLQEKIGTTVEISRISLDFPKRLVLEDVYFEDQRKDTLLAGDTLRVDISLLKLLRNRVEINEIDLRGITANVQRNTDSSFNFDYILHAFVGEQNKEPAPQDTTSALKFSVDKINLDRIIARYKDDLMATDAEIRIGHIDTRMKEFDVDKMKFTIPAIRVSGLAARIIQLKPAAESQPASVDSAEAAQPVSMDLSLGTIDADRITFYYKNDISAILTDLSLGRIKTRIDKIDMRKQEIALNTIDLRESDILLRFGKRAASKIAVKEAKQEVAAQSANWKIAAKTIRLSDNNITYHDFNLPVQKRGMDFGHLDIRGLDLGLNDLRFEGDSVSGGLINASFKEKSGFSLIEAHSDFFYGPHRTELNNLYISTPKSEIRDRLLLSYPSIASISADPSGLYIDANLNSSRISFNDILTFMPDMAALPPFKDSPNAVVNVTGRVKGLVSDLSVPNVDISGFKGMHVAASGRIKGMPDVNKAWFDVNIREFTARSADLAAFAPPGSIPPAIRLPEAIRLKGTVKGGLTAFSTNLNLNSDFGSATLIAAYNARVKGKEKYTADVKLFNFDAGRLLKQDTVLGRVTAAARISGEGIDPKKLNADFAARIIKAEYNGFAYRDISLSGSDRNGYVDAKAAMNDANLAFTLTAKADLSGKYPAVDLLLDLDSANLKALHFVTNDFRFSGRLEARLPTADPDYLNGTISLTQSVIARNNERYQLDSVNITATAGREGNILKLTSEALTANMTGTYKLTQLGYAFQELVNRYFAMGQLPAKPLGYTPQQLTFSARLINGPLIARLAPDLKELSTITVTGSFNSGTGELLVNGAAPRILYGTNDVNNLSFTVNTANNALNYSFGIGKISTPQLQLLNTSLTGKAQENVLSANLQIKDRENKTHYLISGDLRSSGTDYLFSIHPDGLLLNYTSWTVNPGNEIRFGSNGIQASSFELSNANQQLNLATLPPGMNNPLQVTLRDFRIETLTAMVQKDSLLAGGTINGNMQVSNLRSSPTFTADMRIGQLNFRGDTLGNIALKVNNDRADVFAITAGLTGNGNQLDLSGSYNTADSRFSMNLDIATLSLKSLEGFSFGAMDRASGNISGKLSITGSPSAPSVLGTLNFSQAALRITMLGSYFRVRDNQIDFNETGIRLNDFTLVDSAGNTASVVGNIYTETYTSFRFDLNVNSDDFRGLNSTAKDNELYYGQLYFDTRLRIGGTLESPEVDGTIRVNEKTRFTIVLPQPEPGVEEREGIVEFIDMDNPELAKTLSAQPDSLNQSSITGLNVSLNIEVDKNAEFNIIVDAANGDFLQVRGDAKLNAGIDPSGKITMTGTYILNEGAYELSFNFLRRRFEIKQGSTITWTGEPTTADVDVTATYIANTAPLDLVDNVLGDASAAQRNTYKQKLPFNVNLTLKGELMKPDISFDIILPERNYNVSSEMTGLVNDRLTQLRQEPSEMNKQVFALLLLNRFVGENPFASSSASGGAESFARQSVSRLLSEQLNNLAGDLIAGVELNFDLQASDDYTTGELANRTDLNVGLSKRLLNDRLKVNVGSNFELEGPKQPGARTSNFAGDISLEYQLSRSGAYLLKAYQKNEYQVALQGQVVETGVGFVLTMDYNRFVELFRRRTPEDRARRRAAREANKLEKEQRKEKEDNHD
jgi:hypothetical protein